MITNLTNVLEDYLPGYQPEYIFEAGSNDGSDTALLNDHYPKAVILTMEPVPSLASTCRNKFSNRPNIIFVPEAVSEVEGMATFYESDTCNKGIGSLYKPSGLYPLENMATKEIKVPCRRLDEVMRYFSIPKLDVLWLDMQGGELGLLKSMGSNLKNTKFIYTEYLLQPMYSDQPLLGDINEYLTNNGFVQIWRKDEVPGWFGNSVYVNANV